MEVCASGIEVDGWCGIACWNGASAIPCARRELWGVGAGREWRVEMWSEKLAMTGVGMGCWGDGPLCL